MRGLLNVSSCTHRVNQRACRFANKSHVKVGQGAGFLGAMSKLGRVQAFQEQEGEGHHIALLQLQGSPAQLHTSAE